MRCCSLRNNRSRINLRSLVLLEVIFGILLYSSTLGLALGISTTIPRV